MSLKPWKPLLLTALTVGAGATAATAQTVAAAQRSIELGRYNEARASLRGNNTLDGNFELGRLYQMRDLPDSAAYYFNRAGADTPMGMVAEGRALLAKGNAAAANTKFDAAAKASKNKDAKVLTAIVQAYAESDIKDQATVTKALAYADAAQLANKGKDDPALMVYSGDVSLKQPGGGGGGEAMTRYERAKMANPNYTQAYYRIGVLDVSSRNAAGAIENFNKVKTLDPKYAPVYYEEAGMYATGGQFSKALPAYEEYARQAEPSARTTQQYAAFLYLSKKYPEALVEINKALVADPNNLTMNRLKAYSSYETGDYAGAGAAMDQFMKIAPADKVQPDDYLYQAKILNKLSRSDEANAAIQKASAVVTDPVKRGEILDEQITNALTQKNYPSAISLIRSKASPNLVDQYRLGDAYSKNKQYTKADSVFNIITTSQPTYAPAWQARAQANYGLDPDSKQGLAKPYYEKYLEVTATSPTRYTRGIIEANGYLGYYSLQKGDKPTAQTYYQKVLELDPTNENALGAMKIIKGGPARPAPKTAGRK